MILPDKCPYCNDVMLTYYREIEENVIIIKECELHIDHLINLSSFNDENVVYKIVIAFYKNEERARAFWLPRQKSLMVLTNKVFVPLPYFEPDLKNYKKLVEKIKTYLIFS